VPSAVRLAHDEQGIQQLDAVVRPEHAGLDQAIVSRPRDSPEWKGRHRHGRCSRYGKYR